MSFGCGVLWIADFLLLSGISELFYLHQFSQLLRFLLENVALNWHPAFPEVEQRLLFDDFFVSGDPGEDLVSLFSLYFPVNPHPISMITVTSLGVLSNSLGWIEHSYPLRLVAKFLRHVLERRTVLQLFLRHKMGDSTRLRTSWKETVNIIGSLPDRMANRFQKDLDPFFFLECVPFFFLILNYAGEQTNKRTYQINKQESDSSLAQGQRHLTTGHCPRGPLRGQGV